MDSNKETQSYSGKIEQVIFYNPSNGWSVFRFLPDNEHESLSATGILANPNIDIPLTIYGEWTNHPKFGKQFKMLCYEERLPTTEEGIVAFLGSGCFKGIGEKWAEKIVGKFGVQALDIIEDDPEQLLSLPRFGKKRLQELIKSWAEHRGIRELVSFLHPLGIGLSTITRIYKTYGSKSVSVIKENPYRLSMEVYGIGFFIADNIARKLGVEESSPLRIKAAIIYSLTKLSEDGNTQYPINLLIEFMEQKFSFSAERILEELDILKKEEMVVVERLEEDNFVCLPRFYFYETQIAYYFKRILHSPKSVFFNNSLKIIDEILNSFPLKFAEEQKKAVTTAVSSKIMVLTGGPGTGKTTILKAIIGVFQKAGAKILLAAPTGKAAKRLSESCGKEAKTLHRLLEYNQESEGFNRNDKNPLPCSLLIIDEVSMVDTMLMYHLLEAAPLGVTLILVGDVDQLPSVGPGNILGDIINSGMVPVVELTQIFRQASQSDIIYNAHLINNGEMPDFMQQYSRKTDFYFFKKSLPEEAASLVVELVKEKIPQKFGYSSSDIQVLSPMIKGIVGVKNLNSLLQDVLNPQLSHIDKGDIQFRLYDRVMQLKNNYEKDIFNGDTGTIIFLDSVKKELSVRFDERTVDYVWEELDELIPSYAISIHKSQGGEYPVVVIPLMTQHYVLLQRNLVYTAVTRGKKLVVLVGELKALSIAIKNNKKRKRFTGLLRRLSSE